MNKRHFVLSGALVLTIVAAIFAPPPKETDVVGADDSRRDSSVATAQDALSNMKKGEQDRFVEKRPWHIQAGNNLFDVQQKVVQQKGVMLKQKRLLTPKPTKPVVPPLPFTYIGKVIEDGQVTVFLEKQKRNYLVRGGEVIDGTYRVDKVETTKVVLTYLPLEEQQMVIFGELD